MPYDYLCEFAYYYFFKNLHFIFNKEIILPLIVCRHY
jgi:hypothetical protein